jgi:hypothetical protein
MVLQSQEQVVVEVVEIMVLMQQADQVVVELVVLILVHPSKEHQEQLIQVVVVEELVNLEVVAVVEAVAVLLS